MDKLIADYLPHKLTDTEGYQIQSQPPKGLLIARR